MDGGTNGPARPRRLGFGIGAGLSAAWHGLALCALTPSGVILLVLVVSARGAGPGKLLIGRSGAGPGPGFLLLACVLLAALAIAGLTLATLLIPGTPPAVRRLASLHRRLISDWCGVPIADPYLTPPGGADAQASAEERFERLLNDPAAWRDLLWLSAGSWVALVLAAAPAVLTGYGVIGFGAELSGTRGAGLSVPLEVGALVLGLAAGPWLLRAYGRFARLMLAPTGQAELELRARHLARTRSEAIDSGAAEIRRIERDLHDGAQARLVAMGMTLERRRRADGRQPRGGARAAGLGS